MNGAARMAAGLAWWRRLAVLAAVGAACAGPALAATFAPAEPLRFARLSGADAQLFGLDGNAAAPAATVVGPSAPR